ncbi:hypothetical protein HaloA020_34830 [Halomonas sp. A020]|uniref:hypothetical protein n=1 Tax=Halomonas sp. A020 TaxID=2717374 RepID=UPI002490DC9E|nr:hypothetical protein [Halomonas sp. A020]BCB62782.1 hypothetical protein HaloA020_34830 [Halomonas sp. A020]
MKLLDRVDGLMAFTKATIDIARGGGDPATVVIALRERLQTLREDLLTVREEVTTLREEKRELEERLAQRAEFESERHMYTLVTLETGSVVYKRDGLGQGANSKPVYFCAHCFEKRRRSIIQVNKPGFGEDGAYCPECSATFILPNDKGRGESFIFSTERTRGF